MSTCKTCGHEGDEENPLGIQGSYIVPYCHTCLKTAEKEAAEAIVTSQWYIDWNTEKEEKEK